jgi:hypothetical protein
MVEPGTSLALMLAEPKVEVHATALADALFGAAAKAWREFPNGSRQPQTLKSPT